MVHGCMVHGACIILHHENKNNYLAGGGHFVFGFGNIKIKINFCLGLILEIFSCRLEWCISCL
jgi:hypothetical protein